MWTIVLDTMPWPMVNGGGGNEGKEVPRDGFPSAHDHCAKETNLRFICGPVKMWSSYKTTAGVNNTDNSSNGNRNNNSNKEKHWAT
jgi:hypothetical protein